MHRNSETKHIEYYVINVPLNQRLKSTYIERVVHDPASSGKPEARGGDASLLSLLKTTVPLIVDR